MLLSSVLYTMYVPLNHGISNTHTWNVDVPKGSIFEYYIMHREEIQGRHEGAKRGVHDTCM